MSIKTRFSDPYNSARLRLTALYFISMFVIIGIFSAIMVLQQVNQFNRFLNLEARDPNDLVIQFQGEMYNQINSPQKGLGQFLQISDITDTAKEIERNFVTNVMIVDLMLSLSLILVSFMLATITLKPIKDALDQQKKFIADASHEFKTPLAVIKTEAEVLLRDKNAVVKDFKEFLGSTVEEVDRMSELTSNLLDIARFDVIPGISVKENVDLNRLVSKCVDKFCKTAKKNNVKIESKHINEKLEVISDSIRLEQLLSILIDNAIKYNKPNGSVIVSTNRLKEGKVELIVEDTGIGIPKSDTTRIFNRFYRVTQDRNKKGFGLGLSIANQIVSYLGAQINVESELDKGTKITVIL